MRFAKGHGTENDFVIIPDPDGEIDLTPGLVARLCDRRAGLGADGVLRAVRLPGAAVGDRAPGPGSGPGSAPGPGSGTAHGPGPRSGLGAGLALEAGYDAGASAADGAEWFMDYRNADGSVAEMCGNGIRVFGRYLLEHRLVPGPEFVVATRAGTRLVRREPDGEITVDMGPPQVLGTGRATLAGRPLQGLRVSLGNPHLACVVDGPLAGFDLSQPPRTDGEDFPAGVNLELVRIVGPAHIAMLVHERGSGPTRSCGTGAVAAAVAAAAVAGTAAGPPPAAADPAAAGPSSAADPAAAGPSSAADPAAAGPSSAADPAAAGPSSAGDPAAAGPSSAAAVPPGTWIVDVPGGRLRVTLDGRTSLLSGPAVIVAEGELDEAWLAGKPDQSSPAA
jgi:diaminopimelate epimerase